MDNQHGNPGSKPAQGSTPPRPVPPTPNPIPTPPKGSTGNYSQTIGAGTNSGTTGTMGSAGGMNAGMHKPAASMPSHPPTPASATSTTSGDNSPQTPPSMPDAAQVKEQIVEKAQDVKQQAQDQTAQFVGQAKQQAQTLLGDQKDRAVDVLGNISQAVRSTGEQLRQNDQGMIAQYTDKIADRVEGFSSNMGSKDVQELVADLERFARTQPLAFLGGAFALGLMAARFLKSSGSNVDTGNSSTNMYTNNYERTYGRTENRAAYNTAMPHDYRQDVRSR